MKEYFSTFLLSSENLKTRPSSSMTQNPHQINKDEDDRNSISQDLVIETSDKRKIFSRSKKSPSFYASDTPELSKFVIPEIKAVLCWVISTCMLRGFTRILLKLTFLESQDGCQYGDQSNQNNLVCQLPNSNTYFEEVIGSAIWKETITPFLSLVKFLSFFIPAKAANGMAPAFFYGSTWLLYPIRNKFGTIPNMSVRISELMLDRISARQLFVIIPIHFLCVAVVVVLLRMVLPTFLAAHTLAPIVYSEDNPWIIDFIREVFVNALYSIGVLILPALLELNSLPNALVNLILYPLFSFGVDSNGLGSTSGPNIIYALSYVSQREKIPFGQTSHLLGPILGGILGGKIMARFFPDDSSYQMS